MGLINCANAIEVGDVLLFRGAWICLIDLAVSCYVAVIEEHPLFCLVAMDDGDDEGDEEDAEDDEDDLGVK